MAQLSRMAVALVAGAVAGCGRAQPDAARAEAKAPAAEKSPPPATPKGKTISTGPVVSEERVGNLIVRSSYQATFGAPVLFFRKGDEITLMVQTEEDRKAALKAASLDALFVAFRWTPEKARELISQETTAFTGSLAITYEKQTVTRAIASGRIAPAPAGK